MSILNVLGGLAANYFIPGSGLLGFAGGAAAAKGLEGLLFDDDDTGEDQLADKLAKFNQGPGQQEGWDDNLYKSRYTGEDGVAPAFSTAEERDAYDRTVVASSAKATQIQRPYQGFAQGGIAQLFAYGGQVGAQNQLGQPTMAPYPGYAGAGALEMSPYEGSIDKFYNQPLHQYGQYLEKEYGKPDFPQKRNQFLQEVSQKEQQTFRNNNNMFNPYPLGGPNIGGNPMDFKIGQPIGQLPMLPDNNNNNAMVSDSIVGNGYYDNPLNNHGSTFGVHSGGIFNTPLGSLDRRFARIDNQGQFAAGGLIQGPGTVTSDSIPGQIMQNGQPVEEIAVANGEVILSGKDLARMDPDGDMKRAGMRLGGAANGTRGAEAARMFAEVSGKKGPYNG